MTSLEVMVGMELQLTSIPNSNENLSELSFLQLYNNNISGEITTHLQIFNFT